MANIWNWSHGIREGGNLWEKVLRMLIHGFMIILRRHKKWHKTLLIWSIQFWLQILDLGKCFSLEKALSYGLRIFFSDSFWCLWQYQRHSRIRLELLFRLEVADFCSKFFCLLRSELLFSKAPILHKVIFKNKGFLVISSCLNIDFTSSLFIKRANNDWSMIFIHVFTEVISVQVLGQAYGWVCKTPKIHTNFA